MIDYLDNGLSLLLLLLALLLLLGEVWRAAKVLHLPLELVRARLDGHPGAVEAEGVEALLPAQPPVAHAKLRLGQGEGVAKVKLSVHVGVGEGHHVGGGRVGLGRGIFLEDLVLLPLVLHLRLDGLEEFHLEGALALNAGHDGGWRDTLGSMHTWSIALTSGGGKNSLSVIHANAGGSETKMTILYKEKSEE